MHGKGETLNPLDTLLSRWVRLGAMFNVSAAAQTPDIEMLLIASARILPEEARLFAMTVSWLARYHRLVCRHRLAAVAEGISDPVHSATLGYVLSAAGRYARTDHFNLAVKGCRPLSTPQPLYHAYQRNSRMVELARQEAEPLGVSWGLWTPSERLYEDVIQPAAWVMKRNPSLRYRAFFGGQLAGSILATLKANPEAGRSESALSRACRATRCSVREALEHLELCRLIDRRRVGASAGIVSLV